MNNDPLSIDAVQPATVNGAAAITFTQPEEEGMRRKLAYVLPVPAGLYQEHAIRDLRAIIDGIVRVARAQEREKIGEQMRGIAGLRPEALHRVSTE